MNIPLSQNHLAESRDYREFLRRAFTQGEARQSSSTTVSAWAKRCGFASRAHLNEILSGKRRVTIESFHRLSQGLALQPSLQRFFYLLVVLEHPEIARDRTPNAARQQQLAILRRRLSSAGWNAQQADLGVSPAARLVLATMGPALNGTKFSEISQRSGLRREICHDTLLELESLKIVRYDAKARLYFQKAEHVELRGLGQNQGFQRTMQEALLRAQDDCARLPDSPQHLFLNSAFFAPASLMPKLKSELREVLIEFIDRHAGHSGEAKVELTVACGPRRDRLELSKQKLR